MITDKVNTKEIFAQLDDVTAQFLALLHSADEKIFDKIPFTDSWTVAQLTSHITKSNNAIAQALEMEGKPAERKIDEHVPQLNKMFLDYEAKYKSPEFILPSKNIYSKKEVINKLENSIQKLKENAVKANLSEVINLPEFGEVTKFELLHFVVVHTTRHVRQLKNIVHVINNKN